MIQIHHQKMHNDFRMGRRPTFPGVSALTLIAMMIGWAFFLIDIDGNLEALTGASASLSRFRDDPGFLISVGLSTSCTITMLSAWLISKRPLIFIGIWVSSLALSEAQIPVLQQLLLLCRYLMMLTMIAYGVIAVLIQLKRSWPSFQILGLFLLLVLCTHLAVGKIDPDALLALPMQLSIYVGIFFGLYTMIQRNSDAEKICMTLAVVGVVITLINVLGFKFAPEPMQMGRYKSWYTLSTGFANNYVLLLLPVIWLLINTHRLVLKAFLLSAICAGLYMLVLSGSRNALLTLTVALLIMCSLWRPKYLIYLLGATFTVLAAMYVTDGSLLDFGKAGSRLGKISEKETRFTVWALAWAYIKLNPFWGYGLSTSLADLSKELPPWEKFDAHNAYLGIWLRQGIFGLAGYVAIYFISLRKAVGILIKSNEKHTRSSIILPFSICLSLLIGGLFEENLSSRGSIHQALWALSVTMIFAIYRNENMFKKNGISR